MPHIRLPRKDTLVCALLCFVAALLSFGIFMLQDGGAFTLREDFDFQQIPFTMALHNQIVRGGLAGWCWNLDLGTSAIQGFGFYELGSPFFWVSMLFPADAFVYVIGWIYVLKYVVAGVTAYLFVRRFVNNTHAATAGALLYAFSGFQTANLLFYHFHDVVALFPLLLIGLERLVDNKRDIACFVLAICINALVNYFFFVQDVLFLLLYFGFRFGPRFWHEGPRALLGAILRCFALGVLGTAMAAVLLVPSLLYMLGNPRAGSSTLSLGNLLWESRQALFQLQGMLLPADPMFDHNAVVKEQWTSTSCWLPMVGPSLCIAYMKSRLTKRDWLARILVVLLVVCISPLLSSAFILFTGIYQRWWYILVLMAALASAMVFDCPRDYDVRFGTTVYTCLLVAFVGAVLICARIVDASYLLHPKRFALYVGIAFVGCVATRLLLTAKPRNTRPFPQIAIVPILVLCTVTTATTTFYYKQNTYTGEMLKHVDPEAWRETLDLIALGTQLQAFDPQYRYATCDNRLTLTGNAIGTSSFNSTISNAIGRFEEFFDWGSWNVWNLNKESIPGLSELLGGRYLVVSDPGPAPVLAQYQLSDGAAYVVNQNACPIGFACDQYAITDEVYQLPVKQRALALLQAPVVAPSDEEAVSAFANRCSTQELDLSRNVQDLVASARSRAVKDFWRNDDGFGFSVDMPKSALVYLSVPHDEGWTALVDGNQTVLVDSNGMTLLPLESGQHEVRFHYETPGLRLGLIITVVAWAFFGAILLLNALLIRGLPPKWHFAD